MTDDPRRNAAYLLQLRDDLDVLESTRWEWLPPAVMCLVAGVLSVVTLVGGVFPAGVALGLIAAATGRHAARTERGRRDEIRAILERIDRIEGKTVGPGGDGPEGDRRLDAGR